MTLTLLGGGSRFLCVGNITGSAIVVAPGASVVVNNITFERCAPAVVLQPSLSGQGSNVSAVSATAATFNGCTFAQNRGGKTLAANGTSLAPPYPLAPSAIAALGVGGSSVSLRVADCAFLGNGVAGAVPTAVDLRATSPPIGVRCIGDSSSNSSGRGVCRTVIERTSFLGNTGALAAAAHMHCQGTASCSLQLREVQASSDNIAMPNLTTTTTTTNATVGGIVPRPGVVAYIDDWMQRGVALDPALFSMAVTDVPGPTSVSEPANAPRAAVSVERCALAAPPNASALWAAHVPSLPPVQVGSLNLTLVDSNFTQGWRVVWAKAGLNRATVTRCRFAGITGGAALVLNQACRTVALMDTVFEDNDLTSNGGGVSSSSGSSSSGSSSNSRGNVGTDPLVVINTALGNAQPMAESSTVTTNATGDLVRVTFQRCALTNNTVNTTSGVLWLTDTTYSQISATSTANPSSWLAPRLVSTRLESNTNWGRNTLHVGESATPLYAALPFAPIIRLDACRGFFANNLTALGNTGNVLVFTASATGAPRLLYSTLSNNTVAPGALGAAAVTFYLAALSGRAADAARLSAEPAVIGGGAFGVARPSRVGGGAAAVLKTVPARGPAIEVSITGCTFAANSAAARGGALAIQGGGALTIRNSTFDSNVAGARLAAWRLPPQSDGRRDPANGGGGVWADDVSSALQVANCTFRRNAAEGHGGGLRVSNFADLQLLDSVLADNYATDTGGGAALVSGGSGGGAGAAGLLLGADNAATPTRTLLSACRFSRNQAGTYFRPPAAPGDSSGAAPGTSSAVGFPWSDPRKSAVTSSSGSSGGSSSSSDSDGSAPATGRRALRQAGQQDVDQQQRPYDSLTDAVAAAGGLRLVGGAHAAGLGGGLYVSDVRLRVECGCVWADNAAAVGGGKFAGGEAGRLVLGAPNCTLPLPVTAVNGSKSTSNSTAAAPVAADDRVYGGVQYGIAFVRNQAVVGGGLAAADGVMVSAGVREDVATRVAALAGGGSSGSSATGSNAAGTTGPQAVSEALRRDAVGPGAAVLLLANNTAASGGGLSVAAASTVLLYGAQLLDNTAAAIDQLDMNGKDEEQGVADVLGAYGCGLGAGGGVCVSGSPDLSLLQLSGGALAGNAAEFAGGLFLTARYAATTCPDTTSRLCFAAVLEGVAASGNWARQAGGVGYWTHEGLLQVVRCGSNTSASNNSSSISAGDWRASDAELVNFPNVAPALAAASLQPCPDWSASGGAATANAAGGHGPLLTSTPYALCPAVKGDGVAARAAAQGQALPAGAVALPVLTAAAAKGGGTTASAAAAAAAALYHTSNVELGLSVAVLDYYGQVFSSDLPRELYVTAINGRPAKWPSRSSVSTAAGPAATAAAAGADVVPAVLTAATAAATATALASNGSASFRMRPRSTGFAAEQGVFFTAVYSDDVVTRQLDTRQAAVRLLLRSCLLNEERPDSAAECAPCAPSFYRWSVEGLQLGREDFESYDPVGVSRCMPCPDNAACSLPPQDDPTGSQPLAAWGLGNAQLAQLLQPLGPQGARPLARRALETGGTEPPRINGSSLADFLHAAKSELGAAVELGDRPDVEVFDAGGPAKSPVAGGTAASLLRGVVVPDDGYWHSSMFSGQILECFNDQACSGDGRGAALAKLQAVAAVSFALHRFQAAAAANFSGDAVDVSAYLARTAALQSAYTAAQCGEGYTGPLCGKCAPGYGWQDGGRCIKCPSAGVNTTYYVLTTLFTLLALFLVVRADWLSLQAHSHNKKSSKGQKDSANAGSSSLGRADSAAQHAAAAAANGATGGIDLGAAPSQLPSCLSYQQYSVQPQSPYPPVSPKATSPYPSSPLPPQLQPAPPHHSGAEHQQPPPVLQGDSRRSVLSAAADPAAAAAAADDGGLLVGPTDTLGAAGQAAGAVAMAAAGAAAGATAGGSSKSAFLDASGSISNGVTRMPVAEGNEYLPYPGTTAIATAIAVECSSHEFESSLSATSAATSATAPAMGPAADAVAAVSTAPPAALQSGHSITRRDARKPHSGNQQQALLPPPVSPARSGQLEPAPSSPQVLNVHAHRQASAALALPQAHVLKAVVEGSEGTHSSGARTPTGTPAGNVADGVSGRGGGGGGGSGHWSLKTWDNKDVNEEAKQCYRDNVSESYQSSFSSLIKVLVSYLQVLALIRQVDMPLTERVGHYLRGVEQVTSFPGSLVSIDCSLPEVSGTSKAFLRTVLAALSPFYVWLGFSAMGVAYLLLSHGRNSVMRKASHRRRSDLLQAQQQQAQQQALQKHGSGAVAMAGVSAAAHPSIGGAASSLVQQQSPQSSRILDSSRESSATSAGTASAGVAAGAARDPAASELAAEAPAAVAASSSNRRLAAAATTGARGGISLRSRPPPGPSRLGGDPHGLAMTGTSGRDLSTGGDTAGGTPASDLGSTAGGTGAGDSSYSAASAQQGSEQLAPGGTDAVHALLAHPPPLAPLPPVPPPPPPLHTSGTGMGSEPAAGGQFLQSSSQWPTHLSSDPEIGIQVSESQDQGSTWPHSPTSDPNGGPAGGSHNGGGNGHVNLGQSQLMPAPGTEAALVAVATAVGTTAAAGATLGAGAGAGTSPVISPFQMAANAAGIVTPATSRLNMFGSGAAPTPASASAPLPHGPPARHAAAAAAAPASDPSGALVPAGQTASGAGLQGMASGAHGVGVLNGFGSGGVALAQQPSQAPLQASTDAADSGINPFLLRLGQLVTLTAMNTLFFFYPSVVTALLAIFSCQGLDSTSLDPLGDPGVLADAAGLYTAPNGYWTEDMSQECYVGRHAGLAEPHAPSQANSRRRTVTHAAFAEVALLYFDCGCWPPPS
ncbi:hypothetical protein CHLRE_10g419200v5 [Chlamydomonas reinhardtii]|uniref:Right handed beta helix domain-containing protein n=1 Tax=Chlamydomonas reinhardtii TaxID=3055 RepID=A0A2K3D919_CHLRE|nr:uncharacterized protein CHLRE_10g419200v5 [Chlamydomonas reinhardtii]PNW77025.1 hypothetical protein CHLRE_10g419200v5 [Chlamydomonas reinhardtii]